MRWSPVVLVFGRSWARRLGTDGLPVRHETAHLRSVGALPARSESSQEDPRNEIHPRSGATRSRLRRGLAAFAVAALGSTIAVVTATSAQAAVTCDVTYVTNDWTTSPGQGGFTANLTVRNTGDALSSWNFGFTFPNSGQRVSQGWSANWTQSGSNVTAASMPWNGSLASGASLSLGFNGTWERQQPQADVLHGQRCDLRRHHAVPVALALPVPVPVAVAQPLAQPVAVPSPSPSPSPSPLSLAFPLAVPVAQPLAQPVAFADPLARSAGGQPLRGCRRLREPRLVGQCGLRAGWFGRGEHLDGHLAGPDRRDHQRFGR